LLLSSMTSIVAFIHDCCSIVQTVLPTPVNVDDILVFSRRVLHSIKSSKLMTEADALSVSTPSPALHTGFI